MARASLDKQPEEVAAIGQALMTLAFEQVAEGVAGLEAVRDTEPPA